jgi:hypothetical protein
MKPTIKMPEPTEDERRAQEVQLRESERRSRQVEQDELRGRQREASDMAARRGGGTGMRGLLSGDWSGFRRGGDVGGR